MNEVVHTHHVLIFDRACPFIECDAESQYKILKHSRTRHIRMGYSRTLSRGRMGFLPREHHAPKAHRAQLEGRGGMMLEGGENPFCRGIGVRITFSYSKADL